MSRNFTLALVPIIGVALVSCQTAPPPIAASRAPFSIEGFQARAPVEVAILAPGPVPNFAVDDGYLLRESVYGVLIKKGYTPLAPDYVDQLLGPGLTAVANGDEPPPFSALRSALDTDSFLTLDVINVLTLPGGDPPIYRIEARATLLDGESGTILFDYRMPMTFEVEYGDERQLAPAQLEEMMSRFSARLLSPMPARGV